MGQGWSGEYPGGEAYGNTGINSSVGLGPRIRADSEPPTSAHYGGTKLDVTIPEDEEINATHSNLAQFTKPIASADWKRASTDSGILKEKPGQLATLLESKVAASSTFSDQASLNNRDIILNPPKPRDRSQSVGGYSSFLQTFSPTYLNSKALTRQQYYQTSLIHILSIQYHLVAKSIWQNMKYH